MEISFEEQQFIKKLVEQKKRVNLNFLSENSGIPINLLIKQSKSMGLIIDGDSICCPDYQKESYFDDMVDDEILEDPIILGAIIRDLTSDFVYCPKCGAKNDLINKPFDQNIFCKRCSVKLNNIWDDYYNGKLHEVHCYCCNQLTFDELKYCISCGNKHYKEREKYEPSFTLKVKRAAETLSGYDSNAEKRSNFSQLPSGIKALFVICLIVLLIIIIIFMATWES